MGKRNFRFTFCLMAVFLLMAGPVLAGDNTVSLSTDMMGNLVAKTPDGRSAQISINMGENVVRKQINGDLAVVITSSRVLAIDGHAMAWQTFAIDFAQQMQGVSNLHVTRHVAMMNTGGHVIAYDAGRHCMLSASINFGESLTEIVAQGKVAAAIFGDRAIALAFDKGSLVPYRFPFGSNASVNKVDYNEVVLGLAGNPAVTFKAGTGAWSTNNGF